MLLNPSEEEGNPPTAPAPGKGARGRLPCFPAGKEWERRRKAAVAFAKKGMAAPAFLFFFSLSICVAGTSSSWTTHSLGYFPAAELRGGGQFMPAARSFGCRETRKVGRRAKWGGGQCLHTHTACQRGPGPELVSDGGLSHRFQAMWFLDGSINTMLRNLIIFPPRRSSEVTGFALSTSIACCFSKGVCWLVRVFSR